MLVRRKSIFRNGFCRVIVFMTGRQPKQGTRYEILVAAALKTQAIEDDGTALDLTNFDFNPIPSSFPSNLTEIGFTADIDVVASRNNTHYLIECKSSQSMSKSLKLTSEDFLASLLEFSAIQLFKQRSRWDYRFLLVVSYGISQEISEFIKHPALNLERVHKRLIIWGQKKHGDNFQENLLTRELLAQTLSSLSVITLTDQLLKAKHSASEDFRGYCDKYSEQLRSVANDVASKKVIVKSVGFEHITFYCNSEIHSDNCRDVNVDNFIVHIGDGLQLISKILKAFRKEKRSLCRIAIKSIVPESSDINAPEGISLLDLSKIITKALTQLLHEIDDKYALMVSPGTYDLIIADCEILGKLILRHHNVLNDKYVLREISEFGGLGELEKLDLAVQILANQYRIVTTHDRFEARDEDASI